MTNEAGLEFVYHEMLAPIVEAAEIALVREALAGYHATVVYPGAREAFERLVLQMKLDDDLDWVHKAALQSPLYNLSQSEQDAMRDAHRISVEVVHKSALQSPRVPVIKGLDEAIDYYQNVPCSTNSQLPTLLYAARAYAELQKGV